MTGADIGIIGAGAHGAAVAHHLAGRGAQVHVFERGDIASGPTGAASGVVRNYYTNAFLAEAARDGTAFLAEHADDTGFVRTGGLYLHGPHDTDAVTATVTGLGDLGIAAELLPRRALSLRFPGLDLDGVGIGVWEEGAGHADPAATTRTLARSAEQRGARLHTGAQIVDIREHTHAVTLTRADGTRHDVERLLVAAGPWTAPLLRPLGVHLPLTAERHVVAAFAHLAEDTGRAVPHVLIDVAGGYYARPGSAPGTFWLGALDPTFDVDPDHYDRTVSAREQADLGARAARRAPVRAHASFGHGWASLYDVSPDWQPVIGRVTDRVYVDAGTSGHGFKLAPALGAHVADLLTDRADPRLQQFSPGRFAAGARLAAGFGSARILG
ncbi:FAD-dependent oxidoreductase [Streptomyces sp. SID3343]|uniref:FAD-dependent oxidoreductase n=1 Tax=Streptomyces sp. SID3343 TaxID=2690260 RepID=UPI00136CA44C|nr:FAD-dependent oxidoreductase [Streptomyces sp. SID3343]